MNLATYFFIYSFTISSPSLHTKIKGRIVIQNLRSIYRIEVYS